MNAEQMQKWTTIREKGRTSFLLKRTLLWGTILSVLEICRSEFWSYLYAERLAQTTVDIIFGANRPDTPINPVKDFLTSHIFDVSSCFLLAGYIALAIWTYKEQCFYVSMTPEAIQNQSL